MKRLGVLFCFLALSLMLVMPAMAADYDLVINNGRVMDPETMFDDVANVGIKDGKIVAITKAIVKGKQTIDATGHVVAPGFIDTHYHATDVFASKMALRDGVTTGMDLEAGSFNVKGWYDEKAKSGWQVNYGTSASLLYSRMAGNYSKEKTHETKHSTIFYWNSLVIFCSSTGICSRT